MLNIGVPMDNKCMSEKNIRYTHLILPGFFYTYGVTIIRICWMKIENEEKGTSNVRYDLHDI